MKYAYSPECTMTTTAVESGLSTRAVCETVGIKVVELEDWNCCSASPTHGPNQEPFAQLPVRYVDLSEGAGLDIETPCPACYQRLLVADLRFQEDNKWRKRVEGMLGFTHEGQGRPRPLLEVLNDADAVQAVRDRVVRPLNGLRVVSFYGCVLFRPPETIGWDSPAHPMQMERLIEAVGAEPVSWSHEVDCCGASLASSGNDLVSTLTTRLADAAHDAGADAIVCACGLCHVNLDTRQTLAAKVPVFYFTELIGLAFDLRSADKRLVTHMVDPRPLLCERGLLA